MSEKHQPQHPASDDRNLMGDGKNPVVDGQNLVPNDQAPALQANPQPAAGSVERTRVKRTRPLGTRRKDYVIAGAFTVLGIAAVGTAYLTAPIRQSEITVEQTPVMQEKLSIPPRAVQEVWSAPDQGPLLKPAIAGDRTITVQGRLVSALTPTGDASWTYERDLDVCSLGTAWDAATITYRNGKQGCGDVVSINAQDGTYKATRSSINPQTVWPISSNDRVGVFNDERVDIWRYDMVRTVEYGDVVAKQEPEMQPNEACTITSALTRKELLAVTERCDDGEFLRIQDATPDDSREPEILGNVKIPEGSRLVAIGQHAAAIHTGKEVMSFDEKGKELSRAAAKPAKALSQAVFAPQTQDLKHHMTWYDGENRLYLFDPKTLRLKTIISEVLGTGPQVGDRLLLPGPEGIAVIDPDTGEPEYTIKRPYQRGTPVSLGVAGSILVEKSNGTVTGLLPVPAAETDSAGTPEGSSAGSSG